jgi:5'-nucleotidase
VLEAGCVVSKACQERANELFEKYYPIEIDPHMRVEEKIPIMSEWYRQTNALLLSEGITRRKICDAMAGCETMQFRDGMIELIRTCQEANPPVPILIMSAGLTDVIEEFLVQKLPFPVAPSTMVVSNRMRFDCFGRLQDFAEPVLHMFNKTAAWIPDAGRHLVDGKSHCLLLGDGLGDVSMADGLSVEKLAVGFLNEKIDARMAQYQKGFDVVVLNDGPVPNLCFHAVGAAPLAKKRVGTQRSERSTRCRLLGA